MLQYGLYIRTLVLEHQAFRVLGSELSSDPVILRQQPRTHLPCLSKQMIRGVEVFVIDVHNACVVDGKCEPQIEDIGNPRRIDEDIARFEISMKDVAFVCGADTIVDFIGDGAFNFFDVSAFLNAYLKGCP